MLLSRDFVGYMANELVKRLVANKMVEAGKPAALAERLDYLIDHPELWPEMGRKGRAYVEEHYDIRKLNRQLVAIYEQAIELYQAGAARIEFGTPHGLSEQEGMRLLGAGVLPVLRSSGVLRY